MNVSQYLSMKNNNDKMWKSFNSLPRSKWEKLERAFSKLENLSGWHYKKSRLEITLKNLEYLEDKFNTIYTISKKKMNELYKSASTIAYSSYHTSNHAMSAELSLPDELLYQNGKSHSQLVVDEIYGIKVHSMLISEWGIYPNWGHVDSGIIISNEICAKLANVYKNIAKYGLKISAAWNIFNFVCCGYLEQSRKNGRIECVWYNNRVNTILIRLNNRIYVHNASYDRLNTYIGYANDHGIGLQFPEQVHNL